MQSQEEKWLLEEKYDGAESKAFHADLKKLKAGTPLAYLIGSTPFLNCTIHLDSHPLIPRSETEFWTEKAIKHIQSIHAQKPEGNPRDKTLGLPSGEQTRILDLCAGSGAIGIAVAKAVPESHITFGEIDPAHLPTIEKNLKENNIPDTQYTIFQSDLFGNISGTFNFIFTNPPYIDPAIDRAEPSVKLHEPHLALYGGVDGMECIARIIAESSHHLSKHGQLWMEHEPEQGAAITLLATTHNFSVYTYNDQYNTPRYSVLTRTVAK